MGHSVSTLKLNILFGNGFDGDSGNSAAAGELGRGDVANNGLVPGYETMVSFLDRAMDQNYYFTVAEPMGVLGASNTSFTVCSIFLKISCTISRNG